MGLDVQLPTSSVDFGRLSVMSLILRLLINQGINMRPNAAAELKLRGYSCFAPRSPSLRDVPAATLSAVWPMWGGRARFYIFSARRGLSS